VAVKRGRQMWETLRRNKIWGGFYGAKEKRVVVDDP
jgi:hypothetical protein